MAARAHVLTAAESSIKIAKNGAETVLYNFQGYPTMDRFLMAGLA